MPPRPLRPLQALLDQTAHPPILPVPQRASGNNVSHSMRKTRRTWNANVRRYDLPVNVLGGAVDRSLLIDAEAAAGPSSKRLPRYPQLSKVKMTARGIKSVEKAGGLEAMLLSRPSKHFTAYGKQLRHSLFNELHLIREEMLKSREENAGERQEEAWARMQRENQGVKRVE